MGVLYHIVFWLGIASASTVLLIAYARHHVTAHKNNNTTPTRWLGWTERHSGWIALVCGILFLVAQNTPRPLSKAQIDLQQAVYGELQIACHMFGMTYAGRHSGQDGVNKVLSLSLERGGRRADFEADIWDDLGSLPALTYSQEEWMRMRPVFVQDLPLVQGKLRDVLNGHSAVLSAELQSLVVRTQREIETDIFNYQNLPNVLDLVTAEGFDSRVRQPVSTFATFCRQVNASYPRS